jgi:hypothetical protein
MIVNGLFDWAVQKPGPASRRQPWDNTLTFIFHHSQEGVIGSYDVMQDPSRPGIAWHGTIAYDGTLYQHYPVQAGLYHGGAGANPYGPGFEAEGGIDDGDEHTIDEPLTEEQKATFKRIHADIAQFTGRVFTRANGGLKEHGEVAPTACPSHRYDELWKELAEDMTKDEVLALIKDLQNKGALASTTDVLSCVGQIVGSEPTTYTDTVKVEAAREAIKELALSAVDAAVSNP